VADVVADQEAGLDAAAGLGGRGLALQARRRRKEAQATSCQTWVTVPWMGRSSGPSMRTE
jgi:hypothetical protein